MAADLCSVLRTALPRLQDQWQRPTCKEVGARPVTDGLAETTAADDEGEALDEEAQDEEEEDPRGTHCHNSHYSHHYLHHHNKSNPPKQPFPS